MTACEAGHESFNHENLRTTLTQKPRWPDQKALGHFAWLWHCSKRNSRNRMETEECLELQTHLFLRPTERHADDHKNHWEEAVHNKTNADHALRIQATPKTKNLSDPANS